MKARRSAAAVSVALAVGGVTTSPAGAASEPGGSGEVHCNLDVEGVRETGELITGPLVCYSTLAESMAAAGPSLGEGTERARSFAAASSGTIARHFDGANRTGSSIVISGTDCAGGYINLSSAWTNRISSTSNECPVVTFFDGFDKTGTSEASNYNLTTLNNRANSVAYGT